MPMVTVIIPCFNQGRYLPDAVNSVLAQTHADWECIIVNDGSTDNTREVALALAAGDERIKYLEQRNKGRSAARNRGLTQANGRYIQFLDADDYLLPEKFAEQIGSAPATGRLLVFYCCCDCVSEDGTVVPGVFSQDPFLDATDPVVHVARDWASPTLCIPVHSWLFDARIFDEHHVRFDGRLHALEDFECWLRVLELGPLIIRTRARLAVYRWHEGQTTLDGARMIKGRQKAVAIAYRYFAHRPEVREALRPALLACRAARGKRLLKPFTSLVPLRIKLAAERLLWR